MDMMKVKGTKHKIIRLHGGPKKNRVMRDNMPKKRSRKS